MRLPPVDVSVRLCLCLEQLLEERAVVDERLHAAASVPTSPFCCDRWIGVSCSVVLDDRRVIDRDVGRLLVKVVDRVAALAHHLGHEPIRVAHCARRIVDERGLHRPPAVGVVPRTPRASAGECRACLAYAHARPVLSPLSSVHRPAETVRSYSGPNRSFSDAVRLRRFAAIAGDDRPRRPATTIAAIKIHTPDRHFVLLSSCRAEYPSGCLSKRQIGDHRRAELSHDRAGRQDRGRSVSSSGGGRRQRGPWIPGSPESRQRPAG